MSPMPPIPPIPPMPSIGGYVLKPSLHKIALGDGKQSTEKRNRVSKNVVIRLDRNVTSQDNGINNPKGRSMRDNFLIHHFHELPGEDLSITVPRAIKDHLREDVNFTRIHRNSA
ncbi:hypothetical protein KUTeg_008846 [Tegillarca granosa]|uniref:Uncharacterized protein n=1 Tax=Tegillarca granosa TaxID=220873 RepID=A0ABQ9FAC7_TEGGR|nr:hypothetical protein KUTeg_008846 [Tegillarca granosa]